MKKSIILLYVLFVPLISALEGHTGHTLSSEEHHILKNWLGQHLTYRQATDADCNCEVNIQHVREGAGGVWKPLPNYHPYIATGDFNGDGVEDFAVVLIDSSKKEKNFTLVVFNGPFKAAAQSPAFIESGMDLKSFGLFYGPPRPKPYRLVLGPFESDSGVLLIPHGRTYQLESSGEE